MPTAEANHRSNRQARIERYSRAVRWMKVALPVGAVLLIGLIFVFGRERAAVIDIDKATDLMALGTGLKLDNPRFAGVTEDGDPFVVTADWALPDGAAPDRVGLQKPAGELRLPDETLVTVQAATGELFRKDERLNLTGDVVVVTSDGYRIETRRVEVDLDRKTAVAPERLHASGPRGGVEADRVRFDRGEGRGDATVRFEGRVHVTLAGQGQDGANGRGADTDDQTEARGIDDGRTRVVVNAGGPGGPADGVDASDADGTGRRAMR